jgi:hypothetical protein
MRNKSIIVVGVFVILFLLTARPALAHQPYFEDSDSTAGSPWPMVDPAISLALYFTLDSPTDVDYFTFTGRAGQSVLLSMTIPAIAGQEEFTPTLVFMGPGLPAVELPAAVQMPAGNGGLILRAATGKAATFFEPFTRTSYWRRQQETIKLPADGRYTVAIWSESGQVGRYTFAPGTREIFGGDLAFVSKLKTYWTPVPAPAHTQATSQPSPHSMEHCSHRADER